SPSCSHRPSLLRKLNREGRCRQGPFIGFANINLGVCCRPTGGTAAGVFFATVGIHAIPRGWTIVGFGYPNDQCRNPLNQFIRGEGDGSDLCLYHTGHSFVSAKYEFYEKSKRSDEEVECKEKAKATGDGSVFSIADMDEEEVDKMACYPTRNAFSQNTNRLYVHFVIQGYNATDIPQLNTSHRLKY
ncbi:hypothetical protein LB507_005060, partial [Fusarium sp. FIESC RH6]